MKHALLIVSIASLSFVGCGGNDSGSAADAAQPVAYSAPVILTFSVKSSEAGAGIASKEKKLDNEAGDPYKVFIDGAIEALDGSDPSRVSIVSISLLLGAQTTGVTSLDQVFTKEVEVLFIVDDTNNTFKAGHVVDPTTSGPVTLEVDFDHSMLGPVDKANFLQSNKVRAVIRGDAANGFAGRSADARLQVTFEFQAFE